MVAAELVLMRFDLPFCEPFFTNALSSSIGIGNTIVVLFSAPTSESVCRKRICMAIGCPSIVSAASRRRPDA